MARTPKDGKAAQKLRFEVFNMEPNQGLAYPSLGARICGPPAIDCEFKTIDFLTVLDLRVLKPRGVKAYSGLSA